MDPTAVAIHRNANMHARKDPVALLPKTAKAKKPPQHTRKAVP